MENNNCGMSDYSKDTKNNSDLHTRLLQPGQKGTILIMDDEESILIVTGKMLKILGYDVLCARNGLEALLLFSEMHEKGTPVKGVIMDLIIRGGIGGKAAMEALRQIDPAVKAIVSSGYSHDPIMADYRQYGFSGVLVKPYKFEDLRDSLQKLMEQPAE